MPAETHRPNRTTNGPSEDSSPSLPEITVKAVILGVLLSVILAGANAYLGLKAGMTVSASIPAAVISMAVLKLFRRSNILENNIVQTAASAGESLAAGVVFTLPALVLLGTWTTFNYLETTVIAALGGLMGVLFTVPLRRALVIDAKLAFPEGVATAEVLEVGEKGSRGIWQIACGGILGAVFKLGETGLRLWSGSVALAGKAGGAAFYVGTSLAPALTAVGYIVGLNIAVLVFLGGALNWFVAIPIVAANSTWAADPKTGLPLSAGTFAKHLWSEQTRFIGVGAMLVGGLWAVVRLWPSLVRGVRAGLRAYRQLPDRGESSLPRTERDAPMNWVALALVASVVPMFFVFRAITASAGIAAVMALVMLVAGFVFSAVASYMAGIVGSSNNPVSGVTLATVFVTALILLGLGMGRADGPAAAVLVGAVVCCAAAIGGDNIQDLKTGHLVGATPWKQQVMQAVGVLSAAFVLAPIMSLLLRAYGIGSVPPRRQPAAAAVEHAAGAEQKPDDESQRLEAPQASLMKALAQGVFDPEKGLPWGFIAIGAGLAVAVIAVDLVLERRRYGFRAPVLAVAVGVYLPVYLGVAIVIGGLVAWAADRYARKRGGADAGPGPQSRGVLLAAGLITGEALVGILLAIPIVLAGGENPLDLGLKGGPLPGVLLLALAIGALFVTAARREHQAE